MRLLVFSRWSSRIRDHLTLTLLSFVFGAVAVGCTSTTNGTATIVITPAGPVTAVAGGAPVGFSATTTNTSDVINWTMSPAAGAGTLSPSVGRSVFYTPPATAGGSTTTVTLTATVAGVSSSATVSVG